MTVAKRMRCEGPDGPFCDEMVKNLASSQGDDGRTLGLVGIPQHRPDRGFYDRVGLRGRAHAHPYFVPFCPFCGKAIDTYSLRVEARAVVMTLNDYQREAARTGGRDLLPENRDKGLNCAALGLCGEAGEFADIVKKVQHHRIDLDATKVEALRKELGDVLWYVAHACSVMGWTMEDIARANVEKLRKRYPEGFTTAASIAREDERKAGA